jgi:hypothetical protein
MTRRPGSLGKDLEPFQGFLEPFPKPSAEGSGVFTNLALPGEVGWTPKSPWSYGRLPLKCHQGSLFRVEVIRTERSF